MFRGYNFKQKEVINISNAERLGYVRDVEINDKTGRVEALILPKRNTFFLWRILRGETIIPWSAVQVVGRDIILVKLFDAIEEIEP